MKYNLCHGTKLIPFIFRWRVVVARLPILSDCEVWESNSRMLEDLWIKILNMLNISNRLHKIINIIKFTIYKVNSTFSYYIHLFYLYNYYY